MIINRPDAAFAYEGTEYTIGTPIIGTAESEYEGLFGRITEIRDGEDKETENETPDLYCEFDPPVLPKEIEKLEAVFSGLYCEPKKLDDIILDMVIMAPEMVRPLEDTKERITIYAVMEDWAVDGEHGNSCELFSDYDNARRLMQEKLREEIENGGTIRWTDSGSYVVDSSEDSYEGYLDGEFMENHYSISILKQPLALSLQSMRDISKLSETLLPQDAPLLAFIKVEVPFRLREIFEWLPNEAITDEVIDACVDALWSDTNAMFAYDTMDDVITKELRNLGITENDVSSAYIDGRESE